MAGRPRKPAKLRALEGGRGKSRPLTPDLPAPASRLEPPADLTKEQRAAWELHVGFLRSMRVESGVDLGTFRGLVTLYCRALEADAVLEEQGLTMATTNGPVKRAEVGISRDCWKDYGSLAGRFGLTPADRAKIGGPEKPKERAGDVPPELRDVSRG